MTTLVLTARLMLDGDGNPDALARIEAHLRERYNESPYWADDDPAGGGVACVIDRTCSSPTGIDRAPWGWEWVAPRVRWPFQGSLIECHGARWVDAAAGDSCAQIDPLDEDNGRGVRPVGCDGSCESGPARAMAFTRTTPRVHSSIDPAARAREMAYDERREQDREHRFNLALMGATHAGRGIRATDLRARLVQEGVLGP